MHRFGDRFERGWLVRSRDVDDAEVHARVRERLGLLDQRPGVTVLREPEMGGRHDLFRVAADRVAVPEQDVVALAPVFDGRAWVVPMLSPPGDCSERALRA